MKQQYMLYVYDTVSKVGMQFWDKPAKNENCIFPNILIFSNVYIMSVHENVIEKIVSCVIISIINRLCLSVCLCVCLYVWVCVQGWRPNEWSDRHQIWHEPRRQPQGWSRGIGNDATKPEMTSQGKNRLRRQSIGHQRQGNCPIATKFGTDLEWHIGYNIGSPEVKSLNRKWPCRTESGVDFGPQ